MVLDSSVLMLRVQGPHLENVGALVVRGVGAKESQLDFSLVSWNALA